MRELRILAPVGILGTGIPKTSFEHGIAQHPHFIGVDAGGTDSGPHYLGSGKPKTGREEVYRRDLSLMLKAGHKLNIPIIIGSAGGGGSKPLVDWVLGIIEEIAKVNHLPFKIAAIYADMDKEYLRTKYQQGKIKSLSPLVSTSEDIFCNPEVNVVAQMGAEPIVNALEKGANLIVAGRTLDSAIFSSFPLYQGYDFALATHAGEILECGALCAENGSLSDAILATLKEDHFIVEPLNSNMRCTTLSVAAHSLYERSHPYRSSGPGYTLDLSQATFTQLDDRRVKVAGSKAELKQKYNLKLEGSKQVGFRALTIAGVRDPIQIKHIDSEIASVKSKARDYFSDISEDDYQVIFHVYGKNGVMGELEPVKDTNAHELGIVLDVIAKTQELANTICSYVETRMTHFNEYEGCVQTAGNLAFPMAPSIIPFGPVYKFTVYHLLEVDDPMEPIKLEFFEIK